jgi:hypothetical protein
LPAICSAAAWVSRRGGQDAEPGAVNMMTSDRDGNETSRLSGPAA